MEIVPLLCIIVYILYITLCQRTMAQQGSINFILFQVSFNKFKSIQSSGCLKVLKVYSARHLFPHQQKYSMLGQSMCVKEPVTW